MLKRSHFKTKPLQQVAKGRNMINLTVSTEHYVSNNPTNQQNSPLSLMLALPLNVPSDSTTFHKHMHRTPSCMLAMLIRKIQCEAGISLSNIKFILRHFNIDIPSYSLNILDINPYPR